MSSVLIADDHAVVRAGYRQFLALESSVAEVGEVSNAADALAQLRLRRWDLLLLDIHLPDRAGMGVLQEVKTEFPQTRVLVVSGLPEGQYATEALRAGAAGYLSKESAPSELLSAVRRVLGGQRYVSSRVAEQMVAELGKPNIPRHEQLSTRERQVFERLATGATITAVAAELELSIKTVSTYRARILEKMGFRSNADMTSYVIRQGI